jgi:hypothetical protein
LQDPDGTIDLSEAVTSSENSGDLRSWIVGSRSLPSEFQSWLSPRSMATVPPETLAATMPPRYSGNQEIVFPPHSESASGVHSSNDHQVSQPERHFSIYCTDFADIIIIIDTKSKKYIKSNRFVSEEYIYLLDFLAL